MYLFNDKKVTGSTFLRDAQKSACKPLKNKVKKNMHLETLPRLEGIETRGVSASSCGACALLETLPRLEGIETKKNSKVIISLLYLETLPRLEGIETVKS